VDCTNPSSFPGSINTECNIDLKCYQIDTSSYESFAYCGYTPLEGLSCILPDGGDSGQCNSHITGNYSICV
jgi:hypothetical protein